ncbi:ATPase [bacterium]|nr:ATPase [bacterium]
MKLYVDCGTTWTKILKLNDDKKEYSIIKSSQFKKLNPNNIALSTGHNINLPNTKHENEIVALAHGAKKYLDDDYIVMDLGSRDIKYLKYENQKFKDMDWNNSCASSTGATVEMLLKFYDVEINELVFTEEKYSITCGIFGLEKIMDDVAHGIDAKIAISKFVHGIAYNAWIFAKQPEKLCVSGGFCENQCFINSLSQYCKVIPLGRYVLTEGLLAIDSELDID